MRRLLIVPCLLASFLVSGCSFSRAWSKAGKTPVPTNDISGRWEGSWLSEANGHNGRLRAILASESPQKYETRFHAKYAKILSFGYTVTLDAHQTNKLFRFTGEADLGALAGGVYRYDGSASPAQFVANYHSKYDRGIFQLTRVGAAPNEPLAGATQLLVVTTKDWKATNGTLHRFSRANASAKWTSAGSETSVVVGRSGLAWGRGLHGFAPLAGPVKREGDGKSPAGVFRLSSAFGHAGQRVLERTKLPHRQVVPGLECVDDPGSASYNQIVEHSRIAQPDWLSSEKMIDYAEQYRLGIVVDHNTEPRMPGFGSCIFLHIWKGANSSTSGCTAISPDQMESLLQWLGPEHRPVLVQLPEKEYQRLAKAWRLPIAT